MFVSGPPYLSHLIIVSLEKHAGSARPAVQRLTKLIRALGTKGDFSVSVDRQKGPTLHCGFARVGQANVPSGFTIKPIAVSPRC